MLFARPKTKARGPIIIVRHGKPLVDRRVVVDREGYRQFWKDYEAGPLAPDQNPPERLKAECAKADVFFASDRPRSIETAQALMPDHLELRTDPIFMEANLPPPPMIPGMRMRAAQWNFFSRGSWLMGWADDGESYRQAKKRAREAADILHDAAMEGHFVVLAAHGWFNRMLRPELRDLGWRCVRDEGDAYWSARRYEKR